MEGLRVDCYGCLRGEDVRFVAEGEGLGVEAGGFGDEDYGAVEAECFVLICVSEDAGRGCEEVGKKE